MEDKKKLVFFSMIAEDVTAILSDRCCSGLHQSDMMAFGEAFVFRFVGVKVARTIAEIKSLSNGFREKWQPDCSFLHSYRKLSSIFPLRLYSHEYL